MPLAKYRGLFEELYETYHHRRYVSPDPLQFLYEYEDPADQEIVGIIASSLAYGRVAQILRSVELVMAVLGDSPSRTVRDGIWKRQARLRRFKHRFATGENLSSLLDGMRGVLKRYRSLGECFKSGASRADETYLPALTAFVGSLRRSGADAADHLLCDPADGSACKRLNLYLRWMIRGDEIDVGCWGGLDASKLIVPLDTHMFRIGRAAGAIELKTANARAAAELTAAFRRQWPDDPVRFDFCLTRPGIRGEPVLHIGENKLELIRPAPAV